ncbi:MAG: hypothetical protein WBD46_06395, partial [Acidobacteriaceae bacterium]
MTADAVGSARARRMQKGLPALIALAALALPLTLSAQGFPFGFPQQPHFWPGNLVVSRSVYDNQAGNV